MLLLDDYDDRSLLRVIRAFHDLTQAELAKKLGITPGVLGSIERGDRRLLACERQMLAEFLAVDVDEIASDEKAGA